MTKWTLMDRINRINNGCGDARWGCVHVWVNDQMNIDWWDGQTNIDGQDTQDNQCIWGRMMKVMQTIHHVWRTIYLSHWRNISLRLCVRIGHVSTRGVYDDHSSFLILHSSFTAVGRWQGRILFTPTRIFPKRIGMRILLYTADTGVYVCLMVTRLRCTSDVCSRCRCMHGGWICVINQSYWGIALCVVRLLPK